MKTTIGPQLSLCVLTMRWQAKSALPLVLIYLFVCSSSSSFFPILRIHAFNSATGAFLRSAFLISSWVFTRAIHPASSLLVRFVGKVEVANRPGEYSYLFRGGQPRNSSIPFAKCGHGGDNRQLDAECFAWTQLVAAMKNASQYSHEEFPKGDFDLIDISLINDHSDRERRDLVVETTFFQVNPEKGRFLHWPVFGEPKNPDDFPAEARDQLARALPVWSPDLLPPKMFVLQWMLVVRFQRPPPSECSLLLSNMFANTTEDMFKRGTPQQWEQCSAALKEQILVRRPHSTTSSSLKKKDSVKPLIIYAHCEYGIDRTGMTAGAYAMQWLNTSYTDALNYANHVAHRPILAENRNGLHWHALWWQSAGRAPSPKK